MIARLATRRGGQDGSILIFVAILTPVLVAAFAIAVDVGQWFVRQRSLQNQADAAAFAGSDRWGACFDGSGNGFDLMKTEADKYSGQATLNPQLNEGGQLQALAFNSPDYPPTPPTGFPGDSDLSPYTPCQPTAASKYIFDVKATEDKVPLALGGFFPSLTGPNVHATARLELRKVQSITPGMPLAVPDVNPRSMSITLIDQTGPNAGTVLATCSAMNPPYQMIGNCSFARTSADSPSIVAGPGSKTWTFSNIKATVPVSQKNNIVVRVGLGSTAQDCPLNYPGGAGYICVNGYASTANFVPDPPVLAVVPTNTADGTSGFQNGAATYNIAVQIEGNYQVYSPCTGAGVGGSYSCPTDPTIKLRFASSAGSHTYAVDCGTIPGHSGGDFYQQLRYGCADSFQINDADLCPDTVTNPPDCAPVNSAVGDKIGQLRQAMNDRFASSGCAPNHYPITSTPNDARVVVLIVTDFSAFYGNGGGTTVPVVTFAAFYVTGWDGAPSSCDNEPYPADPNVPNDKPHGDIWGHFIIYVGSGTAGEESCDPSAGQLTTPCTPSLVR